MASAWWCSYARTPIQSTAAAIPLKRWHVASVGKDGGAKEIELRSDNPDFPPMHLRREDGESRVIAEFLEVVG